MNLLIRELKSNLKTFCLWGLGLVFLIVVSIGKTSGMTQEGGAGMQEMLEQLPKSIQTVFGVGMVDYSSAIGVFAIVLFYIALIAALHASTLGVGVFAKEERDKTFEFLYIKGMSRYKILSIKLAASLVQLLSLNVITYFSSVLLVRFVMDDSIAGDFLPMMVGVFMIQLTFYAVGLLCSFLSSRMKSASAISSAIVMVCFSASILSDFGGAFKGLRYFTPFKYFDGKEMLKEGLDYRGALICIFIITVCIVISFLKHNKRDLHT